uniref:Uncharacterized protein n=1 Tax=Chromera velia CCMP2878 TaxID=1169474 RepID=A0A0G4G5D1_9ALVE|eukprot:Cvel_4164.t1-p1 / transcript=Cvel_4164.t1 / gene=Cvel_4164 / organism=Chromera_velia_CCMP2878 / gene_product=hypothetical protein / transcript_product=hypothetical protein / location=Cvel_scaffold179:36009-39851(+) / protein_length=246 / sequence_SO=supercontig / SO=protein_coding / is_pseudo=false
MSDLKKTQDSETLKAFLRCHKCIFDDSEVASGNAIFVFRGADSAQRYIYPLELETNKDLLPGQAAAETIFQTKDDALKTVFAEFDAQFPAYAGDESQAGSIIKQDMSNFLRVLQYGVAGGVPHQYMRQEVLDYMTEFYDEVGMDLDALLFCVTELTNYFDKTITSEDKPLVASAFATLADKVEKMKSYESPRFIAVDDLGVLPDAEEEAPEEGTLKSSILLSHKAEIEGAPEEDRDLALKILAGLE